jgi:predicted deacylase
MVTVRNEPVLTPVRYDGRFVELPRYTIDSGRPGPLIVLTSGTHAGEGEISAVELTTELSNLFETSIEKGAVVIFPLINPIGFEQEDRGFSLPGEKVIDMNRSFPGNPSGNQAERFIYEVYQAVNLPLNEHKERFPNEKRVHLDIHADDFCVPYTIVDPLLRPNPGLQALLREYASNLSLPWITDGPLESYAAHGLDKSLTGQIANREGMPSLTVELDERGVHRLGRNGKGRAGVLSLASELGIISQDTYRKLAKEYFPSLGPELSCVDVDFGEYIVTEEPAIAHFEIQIGKEVRKGQRIGAISLLQSGSSVPITAKADGTLLARPASNAYSPKDRDKLLYRLAARSEKSI